LLALQGKVKSGQVRLKVQITFVTFFTCCWFVNDRILTIYYFNSVSTSDGSCCFQLLAPRTAETRKVCSMYDVIILYFLTDYIKQIRRMGLQLPRFTPFVAGFSRYHDVMIVYYDIFNGVFAKKKKTIRGSLI